LRVSPGPGSLWERLAFNLPAGVAGWVIAIAALLFIAVCWCFRWQLAQRYATPVRNPGLGGSLAAVGDSGAMDPLAEPAPERREGGRVAAIAATATRAITATRAAVAGQTANATTHQPRHQRLKGRQGGRTEENFININKSSFKELESIK
jgi:hypothetical protein